VVVGLGCEAVVGLGCEVCVDLEVRWVLVWGVRGVESREEVCYRPLDGH
jgi:hypothetical protein